MFRLALAILVVMASNLFSEYSSACDGVKASCPASPKNTWVFRYNAGTSPNFSPKIGSYHSSPEAAVTEGCAAFSPPPYNSSCGVSPVTCPSAYTAPWLNSSGTTYNSGSFKAQYTVFKTGSYCGFEGVKTASAAINALKQTNYVCDNPLYPVGPDANNKCYRPCKCDEVEVNGLCTKIATSEGFFWPNSNSVRFSPIPNFSNPQCFTEYMPKLPGNDCRGNPVGCASGQKRHLESFYASSDGLKFSRAYRSAVGGVAGVAWEASQRVEFKLLEDGSTVQLAAVLEGGGVARVFAGTKGGRLTGYKEKDGYVEKVNGVWRFSKPEGETQEFGANGLMSSSKSHSGQAIQFFYDGTGRLQTLQSAFGRTLTVGYDSNGRMATLTDPANQVTKFSYDTAGNLSTVTYPDETAGDDGDNPRKQFLFEDSRFPAALTGIIDENGDRYATYQYDDQGRVSMEWHAGNADKLSFEYQGDGTTIVGTYKDETTYHESLYNFVKIGGSDHFTRTEVFPCPGCNTGVDEKVYDASGLLTQRTDPKGYVTTYTYNVRGLEETRTEAYGTLQARTITTTWHPTLSLPAEVAEPGKITRYTYTGTGLLLTQTVVDTATLAERTTTYTYTAKGQLETVDGPRTDISDVTSYSYDSQGNLLTVTNALGHVTALSNYDAHGKVGQIIDPNGLITTLTYTPRGWLKTRTVGGLTTTFDYDKVGQLKKVTMPDGSFVAYDYDAAHRLVAISNTLGERIEYTLDWAGNRTKEEVKAADGSVVLRRSKVFNALNQLLQDLNAANQVVASYSYDANGNLTGTSRFTETGSNSSSYGYDPLNRLSAITDALNGATAFQYDGQDQLTQVTDPKTLVTQYGVDALGQLKQTTSPDTGVATQTFDSAGNVKTSSNARGHTTSYTYDALNRVTKITYHDGVAVNFVYDEVSGGNYGIGRLTTVTDSSGSTAYRYDQFGRLLRKTQTIASTTLVTQYAYDSYGRLGQVTYPSGNVVALRYNSAGQLTALSVNGNDRVYNLRYQAFGGAQGWNWSDGTAYNRSFDLDGRLTSYPLAGQTITLGYDRAGRLLTQTGGSNKQFDYDALDRLTGYTSAINQLFAYDANGNRESLTQDSAFSDYQIASSSNRISAITGADARSYSYDAAGNTLSDGIRSYEYNTANRLSRVTKGSVIVDNSYNGLGQRVRKQVSGSQSGDTRYAYDEAGQLIGEYAADGSLINEVVYLGNMPVLLLRPSGVFNIQTDQLNSPRAILTSGQIVVWQWDSAPFGETLANEDVDGNGVPLVFGLRFPGQVFDAETGLHYNYFRDYDPVTGRYVESDPIGLGGGTNTYIYAFTNPIAFSDPTGQIVPVVVGFCVLQPEVCAAVAIGAGYVISNAAIGIYNAYHTTAATSSTSVQCKEDDDCGPNTRVQAYIQAQFLAGIPRESRSGMQGGNQVPGRTPIPFGAIGGTSRGPNGAEILRNGGQSAGYYNTFDPMNRIEDHPDGHPHQMGNGHPAHHKCPHLHVYGPGGKDLGVITYMRGT